MYRIGIDLGGTNIAAGLVDKDYHITTKLSVPTGAQREPEAIAADIAALCHRLCRECGVGVEDIEAVGIAAPGCADHDTGVAKYANNLPFHNFPLAELVRKDFPVAEVHVENDANAAAWGEAIAGAAKGVKDSIMVTLGTGVGGGVVINNAIYTGFNYAGAELGHMVIAVGGRPCSCGRRGCWEAYSSATGLINMTKDKLAECERAGRFTKMTELVAQKGKVSGRTAFDAKRAGDAAADEVVDMYLEYLAAGLANIINIFQPEVLSIGGGISGEGQYLLDRLIPLVREQQYAHDVVTLTDIRIAELGNDAGIVGAAVLGINV